MWFSLMVSVENNEGVEGRHLTFYGYERTPRQTYAWSTYRGGYEFDPQEDYGV